jgi:DNA-binding response OmpR family regulator
VSELPQILVVEDEYAVQGFVEDVLTEAGFETDILSSCVCRKLDSAILMVKAAKDRS